MRVEPGLPSEGRRRTSRIGSCLIGKFALVLLIGLLSACGESLATPTHAPTSTYTPVPSPTPTPTHTPLPTYTHTTSPTLLPTPTPAPTHTPAPTPTAELREVTVGISSHTSYTDDAHRMHVVGQVMNTGKRNVKWVSVRGRFYGEGRELLAELEASAYIDVLRPGEKAPFRLTLENSSNELDVLQLVDDYALEAGGIETADEPFLGIQFGQHRASFDADHHLTVFGEVVNVGEQPASQVRVSCALYDAEEHVLDVGFAYVERSLLHPEAISPFSLYFGAVKREPVNYHILAYGEMASAHELEREAQLETVSVTSYVDQRVDLVLVGEVKNTGTSNASMVKTFSSFYAQDGSLIAVDRGFAWRHVLVPDERSPFKIELHDLPPGVDHWTVWAEGSKSDALPARDLSLERMDNSVDENNVVTFTGTVRNKGTTTMTGVEVAGTVYDGEGAVVAADWVYLEGDLDPGGSMPFELAIRATEHASTFVLDVQGRAQE